MMSRPPNRLTVLLMTDWTSSTLDTSQRSTWRVKLSFPASRANSSFPVVSMPHATTCAPPAAKRIAIARPMPVVPVTRATFPANSFMRSILGSGSILVAPQHRLSAQGGDLSSQFWNCILQALHDTAQFSEPFQSTYQRIAGVNFLADIVSQQVSVVRTHGNFVVWPARAASM